MRVNYGLAAALVSTGVSGCMVGVTPVIQYGPLTVEMGPQGAGPSGPPTPTPQPSQPQIVTVAGGPGQETLALIAFFPSDVWDYFLVSCAVTPVGSPAVPQRIQMPARGGTTHSIVYELARPSAAGRHLAQLTFAKGRLKEHKPPAPPSWHEAPEQVTLSLPVEVWP